MKNNKNLLRSSNITIQPSDEDNLWEADWIISFSKGEKQRIGRASFAGEKALGAVPLSVELSEEYRNQGFGTEAIRMLVDWAFHFKNIYEVKAQTEHENDKAVKALEKAGFVLRDSDRHHESYSITKNKSSWTGLYLMIGLFLGVMLGVVLSSPKLGMCIGLVSSLIIGVVLDTNEKHERERVTGKKDN